MNEKLNELMQRHFELKSEMDKLKSEDESIKTNIKLMMETEQIDYYEDENENSISYKQQTRESLDKPKVKLLLGDKFPEVLKVTKYEVLRIVTKESKEKMKSFLKK